MLVQTKKAEADPETAAVIKKILHRGLMAGSVGVLGRLGLEAARPSRPVAVPFVSPGPSEVDMPLAVQPTQPAQRKPMRKVAEEEGTLGRVSKQIASVIPPQPSWLGGKPDNPANSWWSVPANLGVMGLAAYGGYSAADKLLDSRRKRLVDQEVEDAKREYQDALVGTSKLAKAVDDLAELVVKQAAWGDAGGVAAGLYTTGLLTSLLAGGAIGHHLTSKGSSPQLVNRAVRERAKRMWAANSQPIHFVAAPVKQPNALRVS